MKKISKTKMFLEAAIVVGIALVLIIPGVAAFTNTKTQYIATKSDSLTNNPLGRDRGWIEQASGFWEPNRGIHYMHAVDENIVWAVGYDGSGSNLPVQEFTKTTNGGDQWEADVIDTAPTDGDTSMIFALDDMTAWVPIHSGTPQGIWKTSDGGDTWVHQTSAAYSGTGAFPNIVHFWNENDGWCQGDPVDGYYEMYTTTDGGDNWIRVPTENIPAPQASEMGTVGYYDVVGDTVWWGTQCVTSSQRVFKSTDRGYTWTVADTPFGPGAYVDIRFKDANNGLAMDKNFAVPSIAETSDGGETWTLISYSGTCYGSDLDYVPGTDNMYVSTGVNFQSIHGASYSFDGGHNWIAWPEMVNKQLFGTTWVEGEIGWAGTFNIDEFTGGMYKYDPEAAEPILTIESVTGGRGITAVIKNIGNADATSVEYSINIEGGLLIIPREGSGDLGTLTPGQSANVNFKPMGIGLGIITAKPKITVAVECAEESSDETIREARIILFRVLI